MGDPLNDYIARHERDHRALDERREKDKREILAEVRVEIDKAKREVDVTIEAGKRHVETVANRMTASVEQISGDIGSIKSIIEANAKETAAQTPIIKAARSEMRKARTERERRRTIEEEDARRAKQDKEKRDAGLEVWKARSPWIVAALALVGTLAGVVAQSCHTAAPSAPAATTIAAPTASALPMHYIPIMP